MTPTKTALAFALFTLVSSATFTIADDDAGPGNGNGSRAPQKVGERSQNSALIPMPKWKCPIERADAHGNKVSTTAKDCIMSVVQSLKGKCIVSTEALQRPVCVTSDHHYFCDVPMVNCKVSYPISAGKSCPSGTHFIDSPVNLVDFGRKSTVKHKGDIPSLRVCAINLRDSPAKQIFDTDSELVGPSTGYKKD